MHYDIKVGQEEDGRYYAGVPAFPGVWAYGATKDEAVQAAIKLAREVIADMIENGEPVPGYELTFGDDVGSAA